MILEVSFGFEDNEALLKAVFLSACEVRLLKMFLKGLIVVIENMGIFLIANMTFHVFYFEMRAEKIIVEETGITKLVMWSLRCNKGGT